MYLDKAIKYRISEIELPEILNLPLRYQHPVHLRRFVEMRVGEPSQMGLPGDVSLLFRHPTMWWTRLSLVWQFTVVSSAVAVIGMLVQGAWVSSTIKESVISNSGAAAAL